MPFLSIILAVLSLAQSVDPSECIRIELNHSGVAECIISVDTLPAPLVGSVKGHVTL